MFVFAGYRENHKILGGSVVEEGPLVQSANRLRCKNMKTERKKKKIEDEKKERSLRKIGRKMYINILCVGEGPGLTRKSGVPVLHFLLLGFVLLSAGVARTRRICVRRRAEIFMKQSNPPNKAGGGRRE